MTKKSSGQSQDEPSNERCGLALQALTNFWASMEEILNKSSAHVQARRELVEGVATNVSPEVRELMHIMTKRDANEISDDVALVVTGAWDYAVKMCRLVYGCDATDFALETLKHGRKKNLS